MLVALLTILGIFGIGTVVGTSAYLFRKRPKDNFRQEGPTKEVITFTLRGLQDVDMICETIDKGNMVILGVKDLARIDMLRLKRTVHQLKSHTRARGGDIIALGKEFVVLVPANMKLSFIKNYIEDMHEDDDFSPPEPPTEVGTL